MALLTSSGFPCLSSTSCSASVSQSCFRGDLKVFKIPAEWTHFPETTPRELHLQSLPRSYPSTVSTISMCRGVTCSDMEHVGWGVTCRNCLVWCNLVACDISAHILGWGCILTIYLSKRDLYQCNHQNKKKLYLSLDLWPLLPRKQQSCWIPVKDRAGNSTI